MSNEMNIEIDLDNAAFDGDDIGPEIARILHKLATAFDGLSRQELIDGDYPGGVPDVNGNKVAEVNVFVEADDDGDDTERSEATTYVKLCTRDGLVRALLELCGVDCLDSETDKELREALVEEIVGGTTTIEDIQELLDA